MSAAEKANRRRAKVRRLRDEGLSIRAIAERIGVSVSTVHGDLNADAGAEVVPIANLQDARGKPRAGATKGNTRALAHGAHSERAIAPLREKHGAELARDYPRIDGRRLALLADRLARIELATSWLDAQGGVVRNEEGEVYAVVKELERWASRAEAVLAEVEAEHRQARRFDALGEFLEDDDEDRDAAEGGDDGEDG